VFFIITDNHLFSVTTCFILLPPISPTHSSSPIFSYSHLFSVTTVRSYRLPYPVSTDYRPLLLITVFCNHHPFPPIPSPVLSDYRLLLLITVFCNHHPFLPITISCFDRLPYSVTTTYFQFLHRFILDKTPLLNTACVSTRGHCYSAPPVF